MRVLLITLAASLTAWSQTAAIDSAAPQSTEPKAVYWREDWATQGNWCERYGQQYALLCGTHGKFSDEIYTFPNHTDIDGRTGGHPISRKLRIRNHRDNASSNVNVLFNPCTGTRVSTQWIDPGEEHDTSIDGPDIWVAVRVPAGLNELSLYFYNYDGHDLSKGSNRDYLIEVRQYNSPLPYEVIFDLAPLSDFPQYAADCRERETKTILKRPVLARSRAVGFAGSGTYKTFLLNGPGDYYIRIVRNHSPATTLNGVFISTFGQRGGHIQRESPASEYGAVYPEPVAISSETAGRLKNLIHTWDNIKPELSGKELSRSERLKLGLYRLAAQHADHDNLLANWRWYLKLWKPAEQMQFNRIMSKSWESNQRKYPLYRSAKFFHYSPNVIPFTADECNIIEYMGIDWKQYLPDSKTKPPLSVVELKDKIAALSEDDREKLQEQYINSLRQNRQGNMN